MRLSGRGLHLGRGPMGASRRSAMLLLLCLCCCRLLPPAPAGTSADLTGPFVQLPGDGLRGARVASTVEAFGQKRLSRSAIHRASTGSPRTRRLAGPGGSGGAAGSSFEELLASMQGMQGKQQKQKTSDGWFMEKLPFLDKAKILVLGGLFIFCFYKGYIQRWGLVQGLLLCRSYFDILAVPLRAMPQSPLYGKPFYWTHYLLDSGVRLTGYLINLKRGKAKWPPQILPNMPTSPDQGAGAGNIWEQLGQQPFGAGGTGPFGGASPGAEQDMGFPWAQPQSGTPGGRATAPTAGASSSTAPPPRGGSSVSMPAPQPPPVPTAYPPIIDAEVLPKEQPGPGNSSSDMLFVD